MKNHNTPCLFGLSVAAVLLASTGAVRSAAPPAPQGIITVREYLNLPGTTLADLTGSAKFPNNPDLVDYSARLEWPTGPDDATPPPGDVKNDYGVQIIGYFYPPANGQYRFAIAADDNAALFLSTDSSPANKVQLCIEAGWNQVRDWDGQANGRAEVDVGTPDKRWNNQSKPITLVANQPYYIEALMKEGGGGDNLAIAYRTDGTWPVAGDLPIPGSQLSTIDKNSGPASIITQPQSQTVTEGQSATFSVVADGTPPYRYQWKKGGTDIPNQTNRIYSIPIVVAADAGQYTVAITGAQGAPATSNPATLTVNADTAPPTISSVLGGSSVSAPLSGVTVIFSERVDAVTAGTAGNYSISGGVTLSGATVLNDTTVALRTSVQTRNTQYTLTVNNVKDRAAVPNTIAANTTAQFRSLELVPGMVKWERWNGGIAIGVLTNNLADGDFGRAPDTTYATARFESGRDLSDNYGQRGYTWFKAPASGNYVFFITVDDNARLFLSTDDNPANKKAIAAEATWSNNRDWANAVDEQRSDTYADTQWPTGGTITLVQNQLYYLEAQWQEGGGGDGAEVTYIRAGDADPTSGTLSALTGSAIALYSDPTGAAINISQQPQNQTLNEGRKAVLSVAATGSSTIVYQWQRAAAGSSTFADIAGANSASYSTPNLVIADSGTKYRVVLSVLGATTTSSEATVTVVPDTFPPALTGVGSLQKGTAIEIGVGFDEPVNVTDASTAANYSLSAGTVTGVRFQTIVTPGVGPGSDQVGSAQNAVVLTTSGLAAGANVTVTVRNVRDLKGNAIPGAGVSRSITTTTKMKWAAVGGDDLKNGSTAIPAQPGVWTDDAVAYSDKDFDLVSSGSALWDNYDEMTFVYESITGDFDKKVRVEYQDASSQWARAGLQLREVLNEGTTHDQAFHDPNNLTGEKFSQTFTIRVNPVAGWTDPVSGTVSPGNNAYEVIHRPQEGYRYTAYNAIYNINAGFGGPPLYPNAWMRLQRRGQTVTCWKSEDGVTWTGGANVTYTDDTATPENELLANTLLVGVFWGPELNNNTSYTLGKSVHAKFREYSDVAAAGPVISVTRNGNNLVVSWTPTTGALESTPVLPATSWTPISGASPVTVPIGPGTLFIRVRQ